MLFKRTLVATIMGFLTGLFCAWGYTRTPNMEFGFWVLASVIASRTVAGFAIGISRWKMPWWLHGPVLGAIFGLPLSLPPLSTGMNGFYMLMGASIVYGFLIELVTSVIFRAKQK
ncbi:MAG: hypothetical protein ABIM88_03755 [candidate division WOR-3 bacterium]